MGPLIISWSIRASLLLLFAVLIVRAWSVRSLERHWLLDSLWSIGFALYLVHVVAAFHFEHHWSHTAAIRETARQTLELLGTEFGGGVYFNYLFLVLWLADVLLIWLATDRLLDRARTLRLLVIIYLLFIAFNGTVIFKTGFTRAIGLAATMLIVLGQLVSMQSEPMRSEAVRKRVA